MWNDYDFSELKGKVLTKIVGGIGREQITFKTIEGEEYKLFHSQNCSELVDVVDIIGDFNDLIGYPLLMAEVVSYKDVNPDEVDPPEFQEYFTWTFYKLATVKGYVTIRWYGESNGYYSEEVNFTKIT